MIVNKVTTGFVTQQYDTETKQFVGQTFTAIDDVVWEDTHEHIFNRVEKDLLGLGNDEVAEPYFHFNMVQPGVDMCAVCEYPSVTKREVSVNGEPKKLLPVCQIHVDAADEDIQPIPLVANPLSFDVGNRFWLHHLTTATRLNRNSWALW